MKGWKKLIRTVNKAVKIYNKGLSEDNQIFLDIKNKWGRLNISSNIKLPSELKQIAREAEKRSKHICEDCGKAGNTFYDEDDIPVKTLCEKCKKKKKYDTLISENDPEHYTPNSFQEGMFPIYLTNWIAENDPERYKQLVQKAKDEKQREEESRSGEMGYAKSVLFEHMILTPVGKKLLESMSEFFSFPSRIIPAFILIAKEYKLEINFDKVNDFDF
jgi:hypothetical protein